MEQRINTQQELDAFYQARPELFRLGLVTEEGTEGAAYNMERIGAFFDANPSYPITVENIVRAVTEYISGLKWKSAAQQAFDKLAAQLPDQGRDLLAWIPRQRTSGPADPGNIYGSKPSDYRTYYLSGAGDELLENCNILAGWLIRNGYPVTHDRFQFGLTNVLKSKDSQNLPWIKEARKKSESEQSSEEQKSLQAAERTRQERAAKQALHPELLMSERARAHQEMMQRQPQKIEISAPTPPTDYWKSRCESAIASLPVLDRGEAQQIMDRQQGGNYQTAHAFILTYTERRLRERASAAQLARMGR